MAASFACVTAAFAAHVASGGIAEPSTVAVAFVVSGALAWLIAGARLTHLQMLGLLVLCQAGVHVASMVTAPTSGASMGTSMWMTHAAATAVCLVVLAGGESFVWAVAQRLALRPLQLLLERFVIPPGRPSFVSITATRPRTRLVAHVAPVRGPPVGLAPAVASL